MYSFKDVCSLCLANNKPIRSILSEDSDGLTLKNKLIYVLTEVNYFNFEIFNNICLDCLNSLNFVYKFKHKCLQSLTSLNDYIQKMTEKNEQFNYCVSSAAGMSIENHFMANLTQQNHAEIVVKQEPVSIENNTSKVNPTLNTDGIPENNEEIEVVKQELEYVHENIELNDDPLISENSGENVKKLSNQTTNRSEDSEEEAKATLDSLPDKSKKKYEKEFHVFETWRKSRNIDDINEKMLLEYYDDLGNTHKASSLWTRYSMLKSTLKLYKNVDISRFKKLKANLKCKSRTHTPKKTKSLERIHVERFLIEAPDDKYLMMKVALIIGIFGGCRCEELTKISVDDIEDKGSYLLVTLRDEPANKKRRRFTVLGDGYAVNVLAIFKKYAALRPTHVGHRRFFLNYKKEKCTIQPVGINTLSKVPKEIATYLNLPNPEIYTGHSFRRLSNSLVARASGLFI